MRRARELDILRPLKFRDRTPGRPFALSNGTTIDLDAPCIVIGGRNGAGKSRLLRDIAMAETDSTLLIDMHYLAEQALVVLRKRHDYNSMAEEVGAFGPDDEIRAHVEAVIHRDYQSIEWFALEMELDDEEVAERFKWTGDKPLIPYFRAAYCGVGFTSPHMGLGEFSAHYLFWILEHFRDKPDLLLLLDEPDAFLPPVGVSTLLPRLYNLCKERGWRLVISTHSEEMIALAAEHKAFTLLSVDEYGQTVATHAVDDSSVLMDVLARPPIEGVIFAEDEVGVAMAEALLESVDPMLRRRVSVVWGGKGHGYLHVLQDKLPRPPRAAMRFAYLYDGDQRDAVSAKQDDRWGPVFLPTHDDPNDLLRTLTATPNDLAVRLGVTEDRVRRVLQRLEGIDKHDWLDDFAAEFGRPQVLAVLASVWAGHHPEEAKLFVDDLMAAWT
jgi:ABC-type cobalamin/Fe3+-siderophores transport system ATPase subunit